MLTHILPSSKEKRASVFFVTATSIRYTNSLVPSQAIGGRTDRVVGFRAKDAGDRICMLRFEESPSSVVAYLLTCFWEDFNPLENS